jgi:hypothetical protein
MVQVPTLGTTMLTGPMHPVPSFGAFFVSVVAADAGVHERTTAATIE